MLVILPSGSLALALIETFEVGKVMFWSTQAFTMGGILVVLVVGFTVICISSDAVAPLLSVTVTRNT